MPKVGVRQASNGELTNQQLKAINLLVYTDKTQDAIADEVDCNRTTLWEWRTKNKKFMDALNKERSRKLNTLGDVAMKELEAILKDNSDKRTQFQAIKAVLKELNVLNDTQQIDQNTTITFNITNNDEENN